MKKLLVTGANGQLGNCLRAIAKDYPELEFLFTDVGELDICDNDAVLKYVDAHRPEYIINCAAYTAVDKAEDDEPLCRRINAEAVANLAGAAAGVGARMIHVSTDYVFDGTNHTPYNPEDKTNPVSAYGRTKLEGEQAMAQICPDSMTIRTAWLYSEYGGNFLKTMIRYGNERPEMRVIADQIGTPTYAADLAEAIMAVVQSQTGFIPGVYHYTNEGVCSWYDFAVSIYRIAKMATSVVPIETKDYPSKAARPAYSVLNKAKIKNNYHLTIPHWETSLEKCIQRLKQNNI